MWLSGYKHDKEASMNLQRSRKLFLEAQHYLPGGVDSPVRAFKAIGGIPESMMRMAMSSSTSSVPGDL
jgi:glutamate-1-semialdehyde aminotransferase